VIFRGQHAKILMFPSVGFSKQALFKQPVRCKGALKQKQQTAPGGLAADKTVASQPGSPNCDITRCPGTNNRTALHGTARRRISVIASLSYSLLLLSQRRVPWQSTKTICYIGKNRE